MDNHNNLPNIFYNPGTTVGTYAIRQYSNQNPFK